MTHPHDPRYRFSEVTSCVDESLAIIDRHASLQANTRSDSDAERSAQEANTAKGEGKANDGINGGIGIGGGGGGDGDGGASGSFGDKKANKSTDLIDRVLANANVGQGTGAGAGGAGGGGGGGGGALSTDREFSLWVVGRVARAMAAPWRDDVYLSPLAHKFMKLTLQVGR